jgi:DHA1 family multidrug resistance protein-like MFS transporter
VTQPPPPLPQRTPWRIQILIYLRAFGCFYQQSVLLPVLPRFAGDLNLSVTMIGLVLAARFIVPALFAAQMGEWTARLGLRRSLLWVGILMIISTPLYMIADNLTMLLIAQIINGTLYMASWIAAQTYATRVPDRDWVLGIFATITAVGMTVGPIIGGFALDNGGYNAAFIAYAAGALLMALTAWQLGNHPAGAPTTPRPRPKGQALVLLQRPGLQAAFLFSFICLFMISLRGNFLPIFLEENRLTASSIGLILAAGSLGQAAIRPFTNILLRRSGLVFTMMLAAIIAIAGLTLMPLTSLTALLLALAFVHGVGAGLHQSLGLVLLADYTSDDERGYAVGLRATINQVSSAGAPLLAGMFADALGMKPAFYLTGIILLASTIWLWRVLQRAQQTRNADAASRAAQQPAA